MEMLNTGNDILPNAITLHDRGAASSRPFEFLQQRMCDDHDSMIITVSCQMLVMAVRVIYVEPIFTLPISVDRMKPVP
jgi:hypothetical protein